MVGGEEARLAPNLGGRRWYAWEGLHQNGDHALGDVDSARVSLAGGLGEHDDHPLEDVASVRETVGGGPRQNDVASV